MNLSVQKERALLALLAAVQFTTVLDFLIVLPLGPQYMEVMRISTSQFGLIISSYAISAGISGLAAGFFLDYFDRKKALLALFTGFTLGTLVCGLAQGYSLLVLARALTGAFGGITGALVLAIIGDAVPEHRRGAAMGLVMSAFSVAMIAGVPCGLYLVENGGWHAPFLALAGLSALILAVITWLLPTMRGHLAHAREAHPAARVLGVWMERNHQMAFVFMAALTCAGALIFPYIPTYMVANTGMAKSQEYLIYLLGGGCTFVSMNLIGRWADRAGKPRVFWIMSASATVPLVLFTNLPRVPVAVGLGVSTLLMICMSGRFVPAMAMVTASVKARDRGGFMSANSSVQQFSMGLGAYLSGLIMGKTAGGELTHFPWIGLSAVFCTFIGIFLSRYLKPAVEDESAVEKQSVKTENWSELVS